ncbi:MAG: ROK family transcriptional regulator [Pseudomonadota bacterium]
MEIGVERQPKASGDTAARSDSHVFDLNPNERRILSLLQKSGPMPGVEIARRLELSAQSASVMTRSLERANVIVRGDPIRGKVGKPLTPFRLNAQGAFSIGLRIGRRSADIVLVNLDGLVLGHHRTHYSHPTPANIDAFARERTRELIRRLLPEQRHRVAGIGIGAPFEIWKWLDSSTAPKTDMDKWRGFDFQTAFADWTDLSVVVGNDASLACQGEAMFGTGRGLADFGYFYVGSFVGGGVYLNGRLFTGPTGNAGAFGSFPVRDASGAWRQLLQYASIYQLEQTLEAQSKGLGRAIWGAESWDRFDDILTPWLNDLAMHLAHAALTVVAAFDVPKIVVDGSFPPPIRERMVAEIVEELARSDHRGISLPDIVSGRLGAKAGALGAAYEPIIARLLA